MCPLQITNDIEHLSSTLHGVNGTFIRHPSNVENYSNDYKLEMGQPNQKKKKHIPSYIFLHLCKFLAQNSKYPSLQKFANFFDIWAIGP